jgi:hypothetical protein
MSLENNSDMLFTPSYDKIALYLIKSGMYAYADSRISRKEFTKGRAVVIGTPASYSGGTEYRHSRLKVLRFPITFWTKMPE